MTTALITGATAGIGRSFAEELARTGHDLVLVARDAARLESTAAELGTTYGVSCEVLAADLSDRSQLQTVADRLAQDGERAIDMLVNNAGFGLKTTFLQSEIADEERQLAVLCQAVLVLSHAAGRAMVARGHGHILNVSSVASFVTMGTYSACKAWVTTFTQALANDLTGTGVGATALCPGYTRTEFHQRMGASMKSLPGALWLDADALVRTALADAAAGKVLSTPGLVYKAAELATGVLPRGAVRRLSGLLAGEKGRLAERNGR
jgi:short-subunit dehydrogenase